MNEKAIQTLEFNKILDLLKKEATSAPGRAKCAALLPSSDPAEIEKRQNQTTDAVARITRNGRISFGGAKDLRASLKRLSVEASLGQGELLDLASLLENAGRAKAYGSHDRQETDPDSLDPLFEALDPVEHLSGEIRRCILSEDEIADNASRKLREIRRQIAQSGEKIHAQLNSMINGSARTYLMDAVITMRDGRYCLPVKAEYRGNVPGMVHDQSSTGATLFIEPMSVVKLNNDVRALETEETREIARILKELSLEAAAHAEEIEYDIDSLAELDFIFAKAGLSISMNATRPVFNAEGKIHLQNARHPLIDRKKVVPIDVRLGESFDLLVVTGPNTGGKTVSLKTVGLLTLMGEAGLHIPASEHSSLAVFDEVYADIGDEQSIEQSLSTFSAHMTHIVSFLEKADTKSLVLFDELCAGTDPTEGAALAIAILSYLHDRGIRTMATTHYSELKIFALSTEGVENASCEFNVETLQPTYRLIIGIPGKSNAFAISKKLGLPDFIIDEARTQISEQDESFEDVLSKLEKNRVALENEKRAIDYQKQQLDRREQNLLGQEKAFNEKKDKILDNANEKAHKVLQEAKDYADRTMKDFRKFGRESINSEEMERKRTALRKEMDKTASRAASKPARPAGPKKKLTAKDLHLGDAVHVVSLNLNGTVSSRPDAKGNLFVRMGIIRSKVNIIDLELIDEPVITSPQLSRTSTGKVRMSKAMSVSPEINLLGKTVEEAVIELDKYLDDASLAHLSSVRIIHGKGTGALRRGVHEYLKRQKRVKSFHLAEYGEGDAGVTIAELK